MRIDEFSAQPDGLLDAGDGVRWVDFGFDRESVVIVPTGLRFRLDEFALVADTFIDAKDRTRFTSVGFDKARIVTLTGGGVSNFPLHRKSQGSRDLPNLEYKDPHVPVHTLVKYSTDAIKRLAKGQDYGATWQGQQTILRFPVTLTPSDWLSICQVSVTVLASISISAEVSWQAAAGTNVNWRFLRDNKILHTSFGHHLANDLKTVTPISELYFDDEPTGDHTYVLQLMTETSNVSVNPPTRLLVVA